MAISEKAKIYHEKMFPGYVSAFLETDPEFIEIFDNCAFDEVVNHDDLDERTRFMAILASLGIGRVFPFLKAVNEVLEVRSGG